jgi:hypothetical protein
MVEDNGSGRPYASRSSIRPTVFAQYAEQAESSLTMTFVRRVLKGVAILRD